MLQDQEWPFEVNLSIFPTWLHFDLYRKAVSGYAAWLLLVESKDRETVQAYT